MVGMLRFLLSVNIYGTLKHSKKVVIVACMCSFSTVLVYREKFYAGEAEVIKM